MKQGLWQSDATESPRLIGKIKD